MGGFLNSCFYIAIGTAEFILRACFEGLIRGAYQRSLSEELNDSPNQALRARLDPVKLSLCSKAVAILTRFYNTLHISHIAAQFVANDFNIMVANRIVYFDQTKVVDGIRAIS